MWINVYKREESENSVKFQVKYENLREKYDNKRKGGVINEKVQLKSVN